MADVNDLKAYKLSKVVDSFYQIEGDVQFLELWKDFEVIDAGDFVEAQVKLFQALELPEDEVSTVNKSDSFLNDAQFLEPAEVTGHRVFKDESVSNQLVVLV